MEDFPLFPTISLIIPTLQNCMGICKVNTLPLQYGNVPTLYNGVKLTRAIPNSHRQGPDATGQGTASTVQWALAWQINGYDFTGGTANRVMRAASLPREPMTDSTTMSLQVCNKERWQVLVHAAFTR
jgi:hypothetical protein